MEIHYIPQGVCSKQIDVVLENDIIQSVKFTGGCSGNTQGVAALAQGMNAQEFISRCKEIRCGAKATSCPAQLALALQEALESVSAN